VISAEAITVLESPGRAADGTVIAKKAMAVTRNILFPGCNALLISDRKRVIGFFVMGGKEKNECGSECLILQIQQQVVVLGKENWTLIMSNLVFVPRETSTER
jgi:hypothetical protein